ncbi:MAG: TetR/AcrR family transcriptional regulator [Thermomicrobiales bacterium]
MSGTVTGLPPKKPLGRPRSTEADQAILDAAFKLLVEQGYARMSMEGVAVEAGVGKTTIYRRYSSKQELIVAVIERFIPVEGMFEVGNTKAQLVEVLRRVIHFLVDLHGTRLIGTLLVEEPTNPELLDFFRDRVIYPRMNLMRSVLRRAMQRGEVREDADLEAAIHMVIGAVLALQLSGRPNPTDWAERIAETLWRAIGTEPATDAD